MNKKMLVWIFAMILLIGFVSAFTDGDFIAYWSYDINASDDSGNGNDGTVNGATHISAGQKLGAGAYSFDGGDWIDAGDIASGLGNISVVGWFISNETNDYIITKGLVGADRSLYEWHINIQVGGEVTFGVSDGTNYQLVTSTSVIVADTYYFIVGTWDGTTTKIYINATSEGTPSGTASGTLNDIADNVLIGKLSSGSNMVGICDEVAILDIALNLTEIQELYNSHSGYNPFAPLNTIDLSSPLPGNNTQWNVSALNLNLTANASYVFNCSLVINGVINDTLVNLSNGTGVNVNFTVAFGDGEYNFSINCSDGITDETTATNLFYVDTVIPGLVDDFVNGSVYYEENLTGQFNFSDNLMLFSFNITVDGSEVAGIVDLNVTDYSYNLSYDVTGLTAGKHTLGIEFADGHTALEEKEKYKVSDGLFNDYMRYDFSSGAIRTEAKDKSIFDEWSSIRKFDRYIQIFEPSKPKSVQVFVETASVPIHIVGKPGYYNDHWLIIGDKWKDYVLVDEPDAEVSIERINAYEVEVTVSGIKNHPERLEFESIGALNVIQVYYDFYKVNATAFYQDQIYEGSLVTHTLEINSTNVSSINPEAYLVWNGSNLGSGTQSFPDTNSTRFVNSFTAPSMDLDVINWSWFFNFSNSSVFNITGNQTFIAMNISNCSSGNIVLNYTIYDEENKTKAPDGLIEVDLTITSYVNPTLSWVFNFSEPDAEMLICLPDSFLNDSDYTLDAIARYSSTGHKIEYHYIQNFNLSNAIVPVYNNLYDLLSTDSTSFLIFYQDENYLYVEGAIIDVLRYYVGEGQFLSVEHSRTDADGQALAHLVAEDIIYQFNVWIDGELDYSTPEYLALCQAVPCQINLRKTVDENESILTLDDLVYTISSDAYVRANREVIFGFSTRDGTSTGINLTILNILENETVCSNYLLASAGSVNCSIPISYVNDTYIAKVFRNSNAVMIGYRIYSLALTPDDIFGQDGIFLTFLAFLTLGLAGLSSGIGAIVLGIVGIIAMGMMNMIYVGNVFGLGSTIMWLMVAGGIIIYKITRKRIQ